LAGTARGYPPGRTSRPDDRRWQMYIGGGVIVLILIILLLLWLF
jgi:hypothetical protein